MDIRIIPQKLKGTITAIPSKSQAHRLLICAAFADSRTNLICPETNRDIEATANCLTALGASVRRTSEGYSVIPITRIPDKATLQCHDSGSTLRFMLPIAGALGVETTFLLEGRLSCRPLSPLWEEMERMGCHLSRPSANTVHCSGKLRCGTYRIDGGVSSQFITGLMFALSLLAGESHLTITGKIESSPYLDMTRQALSLFGVHDSDGHVSGKCNFHGPASLTVEGDWSNAAFFLTADALGSDIEVTNLAPDSAQGDRAIAKLLPELTGETVISAAQIPDLVPILAVAAAHNRGALFTDISRLRLKESDRVASVASMIESLGGKAEANEHTLRIFGTGLIGGTVDAVNDHRIAMAAAIASTVCREPVTILGAECVAKSYPKFWDEFRLLGGNYEQHLR